MTGTSENTKHVVFEQIKTRRLKKEERRERKKKKEERQTDQNGVEKDQLTGDREGKENNYHTHEHINRKKGKKGMNE